MRRISAIYLLLLLGLLCGMPTARQAESSVSRGSDSGGSIADYGWVYVGKGDCTRNDVAATEGSAQPDNGKCTANMVGTVAVCWDGVNLKNAGSNKVWCTYKNVRANSCTGGANTGYLYECRANAGGTTQGSACGYSLGSGIFNKWISLGGKDGLLGCPITNEGEASRSPQGTNGRWAQFGKGDGGYIIWHGSGSRAGQAFGVDGCIFKLYASAGGTRSSLGFPLGDAYSITGGSRQDFEGGYVTWDSRTGVCTPRMYNSGGGGGGATTLTWGATATSLRGQNGQRTTYACPANGTLGSVWGSDLYTDDSSICTAAVHAGLISAARGGTVTIEIRPGASAYRGAARYGVTSNDYGAWHGSYVFVGGQSGGGGGSVGGGGSGGGGVAGGGGGGSSSSGGGGGGGNQIPAKWETQANSLQGQPGNRFTLICPAGGTISSRLWGTDLYTDDSSICTAAVHAGLISVARGGIVTIELRPGASSYSTSTRYGVTSNSYGSWSGSFIFVGGGQPGGGGQPAGGGGICDDSRTLAIMDEWLARAIPPQQPGDALRYEAWGRLVGRTRTNTVNVTGPPDTRLTRCEWLWSYSATMRSTNGLGTLKEYVERRR